LSPIHRIGNSKRIPSSQLSSPATEPYLTRRYRGDIDGLRAIAVLAVVLFHAEFNVFSGGYIGVDIFFVVSGFLITSILIEQITTETFTFISFYQRRIRRLLPALLFTLSLTIIFALILFTPAHLERVGKSAIFAIISISNFLFWSESGYFDAESALKPLLHTWSLSVEEQFYLLWPITLLTAFRFLNRKAIPYLIAIIAISSLIASELWLVKSPSSSYFLTPFRIFELAIGALIVWCPQLVDSKKKPLIQELLYFIGLALITYGIFTFDGATPFPGLNALIPCIGTAFLIYAGESKFLPSILRIPPFIKIGLISYSLYLVHWPVIVFYKYLQPGKVTAFDSTAMVFISLLLAICSYSLIEKRYRYAPESSKTWITPFSIFCSTTVIIIIGVSSLIWSGHEFTWRKSTNNYYTGPKISELQVCKEGLGVCKGNQNADYIIVGDRHSGRSRQFFGPLFVEHKIRGGFIKQVNGCYPFFLDYQPITTCDNHRKNIEKILLSNHTKHIIFVGKWSNSFRLNLQKDQDPIQSLVARLKFTGDTLSRYGKALIIYGQPPSHSFDVTLCFDRPTIIGLMNCDKIHLTDELRLQEQLSDSLAYLASQNQNIKYINNFNILCKERLCDVGSGEAFYTDSNHMSKVGSRYLLSLHDRKSLAKSLSLNESTH
jgi:peptidoglycan/LPS O-acetylase OafA/YrhL